MTFYRRAMQMRQSSQAQGRYPHVPVSPRRDLGQATDSNDDREAKMLRESFYGDGEPLKKTLPLGLGFFVQGELNLSFC
jgi:hypothetical protein